MAGFKRVLGRIPGDFLADLILITVSLGALIPVVFPLLQILERMHPAATPFVWVGMIALSINAYSASRARSDENNELVDQLQDMSAKQISQFVMLVLLMGSVSYGIQLGVSSLIAAYIASSGFAVGAIIFAFSFPVIDAYGARNHSVSFAYIGLKVTTWVFDLIISIRDVVSGIRPERPHKGVLIASQTFGGFMGIDPPKPGGSLRDSISNRL